MVTGMDTDTSASIRVIRRLDALAMGYDDDAIYRKVRSGAWSRLRSGAYVPTVQITAMTAEAQHLMMVNASTNLIGDCSVISHQSAAVVHGIALWHLPLTSVHITRPGNGGGHRRRSIHTHVAPLCRDEIVTVQGLPVTSVARTILDLARSASFESAVVAADSALFRHLTTPPELADARARACRRPGVIGAASVLAFADGRAESAGESRSRVQIYRAGLPAPQLQVPITSADGEFLGVVDFAFEALGTVGEFDGRVKYGRLLTKDDLRENSAEKIGRIMFKEKVREDHIRAVPLSMARWIWSDIDAGRVEVTLSNAFSIAARLR